MTAIICAHNPRADHIQAALTSLAAQTGLPDGAEFILIDNASEPPLAERIDLGGLSSFVSARIVREERLGLTQARIRAFHEARGEILLFIDDDNILATDYLNAAHAVMVADPLLGAVGGKSLPRYEVYPPEWFESTGISLACRDLGDAPLSADWSTGERSYPACAPIGAGMVIRRVAYAAWVAAVTDDTARSGLGRRGTALTSGEDNDMVLTLLGGGWRVAYRPELSLTHLIPVVRLTPAYLERYAEHSTRTWVQVLDVHGIRPWQPIPAWSFILRKAKAYFETRAWRSPANRIRWRQACGLYSGQVQLDNRED